MNISSIGVQNVIPKGIEGSKNPAGGLSPWTATRMEVHATWFMVPCIAADLLPKCLVNQPAQSLLLAFSTSWVTITHVKAACVAPDLLQGGQRCGAVLHHIFGRLDHSDKLLEGSLKVQLQLVRVPLQDMQKRAARNQDNMRGCATLKDIQSTNEEKWI